MENKVRLGGYLIGGGGTLIGVDTLRYRDVNEGQK
jgi:hypothetical protein